MGVIYCDNNAISSGNFLAVGENGLFHNLRYGKQPYSSFKEHSSRNRHNLNFKAAKALEDKLYLERRKKYEEVLGQKFQTKTTTIELIVNLRIGHSMKDLKKIAKLVEETFGYTSTLLSLHADEGHYLCDECGVEILDASGNKTFIANIHGHLRFNVLDPENGKSLYREAMKDPGRLEKIRKFQSEVAQILGMQRGIDKRISGRKRIPTRLYKQLIRNTDAVAQIATSAPEITRKVVEKLTLTKLKSINQEVRKVLLELSATRKEYAQLESIVNAVKDKLKAKERLTVENLERQITEFLDAVKNDLTKTAVEEIKGLKLKLFEKDGTILPYGKFKTAKANGTYAILCEAASQMNVALAYGLNMHVEEVEKMREKRHKTAVVLRKMRRERDEAKKEKVRIARDLKATQDQILKLREKNTELKEIAQAYQHEAIERTSNKGVLVKGNPTAKEVVFNIPFVDKKPTAEQLDR